MRIRAPFEVVKRAFCKEKTRKSRVVFKELLENYIIFT